MIDFGSFSELQAEGPKILFRYDYCQGFPTIKLGELRQRRMQIPKHHWRSDEAINAIKTGKPIVLLECPIICPSFSGWNFNSIRGMINEDFQCDVYVSKTKRFPYWDDAKNSYNYTFEPLTSKESMTFTQFLNIRQQNPENDQLHYYLHQRYCIRSLFQSAHVEPLLIHSA